MRKMMKKWLTQAGAQPIIIQCDNVGKCLTKAPERHFDIIRRRLTSQGFRKRNSVSETFNSMEVRNENIYG